MNPGTEEDVGEAMTSLKDCKKNRTNAAQKSSIAWIIERVDVGTGPLSDPAAGAE